MPVIRLTENDLHRIVRMVLSESMLLSEGYSGKYFEQQIRDIVQDFWQFKDNASESDAKPGRFKTRLGVIDKSYPITISLKPFFKDGEVDQYYLDDKTYNIHLYYDKRGDGEGISGAFHPDFMGYDNLGQISIKIWRNTPINSLYTTLIHEVTHLVDYLISEAKSNYVHKYNINHMVRLGIPRCVAVLLYALWGNSEFNAWQSNYKISGDNAHFETMMGALRQADAINDEDEWAAVRDFLAQSINKPIANKPPMSFKNYFIKTSFKLLKKMVKKYY